MADREAFNARLREAIDRSSYTQKDLSTKVLAKSAGYISRVLNGRVPTPKRSDCAKLEGALGLERDELWRLGGAFGAKDGVRAYYEGEIERFDEWLALNHLTRCRNRLARLGFSIDGWAEVQFQEIPDDDPAAALLSKLLTVLAPNDVADPTHTPVSRFDEAMRAASNEPEDAHGLHDDAFLRLADMVARATPSELAMLLHLADEVWQVVGHTKDRLAALRVAHAAAQGARLGSQHDAHAPVALARTARGEE